MSEKVYNRVALLRTERGMSRKEVAAAVDVNFQTIGYLERGVYNASLEVALKLARLFEVPVETLFSLEPFKPLSEIIRQDTRKTGEQG
ncbi:MAG: helix-turn-helix transcriptional regulator [Oceanicaulis sp.]